ncbi:hypothetical protein D3C76_1855090 [compost metagenome]
MPERWQCFAGLGGGFAEGGGNAFYQVMAELITAFFNATDPFGVINVAHVVLL